MTPIQRYSLQGHEGPYASWPLTAALQQDGKATGKHVPGYVVEAQYATAHGVLLITSYDCPFEESSDFLLLDADHRVTARKRLMAPYASYLLHAHWPIDPLTLALHYFQQLFFTLSVTPPGRVGRRPRLHLQPAAHWQDDARMRASAEHLQAELARIACNPATGSGEDPLP